MPVDTITIQTTIHGREFGLDVTGRPAYTLLDGSQEYGATAANGGLNGFYMRAGSALLSGPIAKSAVASSITDTAPQSTTESTLATINLPANLLGMNDGLELDMLWSCTNSAATKRIRGRFGGTVLWNLDLTTHLVYRLNFKFRNRNSLSSQIAQANSTTTFGPIGSVGAQTFTVDFSAAQALTITGQFPVAGTGTNTLGLEEYAVRAI